MPSRSYVAVAEREQGETAWSILFPDFPEIASGAEHQDEIFFAARDALETAIEARLQDKEALPDPRTIERIQLQETFEPGPDRVFLIVTAELPGNPVRVNVSIDESLLNRIDAAAERRGMTRSGFLAEGARRLLRSDAA